MSFAFDRPIGAPADVTELDYVSALHQTDVQGGIRKDGSIQDTDISLFLSSRYGVIQTPEQVREHILSGLGSMDGYMDMMQLVSLLLIPTLREEQQERKSNSSNDNNNNNNDLLVYTVEMLLHDVTGSRQPKPLTKTLIKQIFQAYGETALSENDELVQEMLDQAAGNGQARVLLDAKTFCRALTSDVQEYIVENKDKLSTNYDDVMSSNETEDTAHTTETVEARSDHTHRKDNTTKQNDSAKDIESKGDKIDDEDEVPTVYTAPHIDNTADTFRSRPLVIFQWTFFVLSFQTYLIRVLNNELLNIECTQFDQRATWGHNTMAFFCTIGLSVLKWIIIMLAMSAVGLLYFGIGGIGNNIECKNPWHPLIGLVISLLVTMLPPFLFGRNTEDVPQEFLEVVTYCLGGCAAALMLWHFITLLIPKASRLWQWLQCILVPEAIRTEYNIKQAASYKIDNMVTNALEVHREKKQETVVPTHFGQALLNFAESRPKYMRTGGLRWTWKSMWNRSLFRREGLLFSGRLMSTNFIQFAITAFILISGIVITYRVGNSFEAHLAKVDAFFDTFVEVDVDQALARTITDDASSQFTDFLTTVSDPTCPDEPEEVPSCNDVDDIALCIPSDSTPFCTLLDYTNSGEEINATVQTLLLNASGLDTIAIADSAADNLIIAVENSIDLYYPTDKYMVVAPLATGVAVAVTTALIISIAVLPSASSTTLMFRSGVLPFVHDPRAKLLRIAPDQTAFLRGIMYWGCFFASILMGSVIAVFIFLYVWQVTAAWLQRITASILGALLVIAIHVMVNRHIRKVAAEAFYRRKPRVANIGVLVRECGLVALTQGFVVFRTLKLFLTTILYVGRLDTPFLYDSLGQVGGFRIDREPYMFMIDVLQHEAHRHPYIETLGVMYLLKLRHRDDFCTLAGSSWRLIFVYVLMPWLSKYRALRRPQLELKGDVEDGTGDIVPLSPPLRAVTLVDPQAYALRAVSLVPVASGWSGGSARSFGRLSLISDDGPSIQDRNEIHALQEENRKLKTQLLLRELTPATPTLNREARHTHSPPPSPPPNTRARKTHSPGFEVDHKGRIINKGQDSTPLELKKAHRVGRNGESDSEVPRPSALKREESAGLATLPPPSRDDGPQVSWADYSEFDI